MREVCGLVDLKREGGWSSGSFWTCLFHLGKLGSSLFMTWITLTMTCWSHVTPQPSLHTTIGVRLPHRRCSYTVAGETQTRTSVLSNAVFTEDLAMGGGDAYFTTKFLLNFINSIFTYSLRSIYNFIIHSLFSHQNLGALKPNFRQ